MLTVIGDLLEDIVVWTTTPQRRGTDNPAVVTRSRGGSAANVAARAAALRPSRFIGRVGDDPAGTWLVAALEAAGVDVRVQRGGRTGSVVVIVDPADGERTMFPDRAAATELAPIDHDWLVGTRVLHVPAYGFTTGSAAGTISDAIEHVRRRGGQLSVDVSAVTVVDQIGHDRFLAMLESLRPDILLANADEAQVLGLAGRRPPPGCVTIIKDGPRPARVLLDDGSVHSVDAVPVDVVADTTGAGDAFASGFLASWMEGSGPIAACADGHRAAAAVLRSAGAG